MSPAPYQPRLHPLDVTSAKVSQLVRRETSEHTSALDSSQAVFPAPSMALPFQSRTLLHHPDSLLGLF